MSGREPNPVLPSDVLAILEAEREAPPIPDAARERILVRLEAGVVAGTLAAAAAHSELARPLTWVGLFGKKVVIGLAALSVGASGYVLHRQSLRREAGAKVVERAPASPAIVARGSSTSIAPATPILPDEPVTPAPAATVAAAGPLATTAGARTMPMAPSAAASGASTQQDRALAAERTLLEEARAALRRGDATAALAALDRHAARFPAGRLVEERESLAIVACARAGRRDEALRRARSFRARWPSSIYASSVDAAVGQAP